MAWLAAVLGAFLFYRFVERPHKILALKAATGLILLISIAVGAYLLFDDFSKDDPTKGLRVEYISVRKTVSEELKHAALAKVMAQHEHGVNLLKKLSQDESDVFKFFMYSFGPSRNQLGYNVRAKLFGPDVASEPIAIGDKWSEYRMVIKKREIESTIPFFLKDLPRLRAEMNSLDFAVRQFAKFVLFVRYSSLLSENRKLFSGELSSGEIEAITSLDEQRSIQEDSYLQALNNIPGDTEVAATICNDRKKTLTSVTFNVVGQRFGRSTKYPLLKDPNNSSYREGSAFQSDYIVAPGSCANLNWTAQANLFSSYEVTHMHGNWSD